MGKGDMTDDVSRDKLLPHVAEMVDSYRRYVRNWRILLRQYESGRVKFYCNNADVSASEIERLRGNIRDIEDVIQKLDPHPAGRQKG
jgi:hypothetical protein